MEVADLILEGVTGALEGSSGSFLLAKIKPASRSISRGKMNKGFALQQDIPKNGVERFKLMHGLEDSEFRNIFNRYKTRRIISPRKKQRLLNFRPNVNLKVNTLLRKSDVSRIWKKGVDGTFSNLHFEGE